ncbi:MAG TPA: hypothetical protein VK590_07495 [Saprospiraceae bacterium]|nr:hypothetical protein [Saprospiraceae bacterium]
MKKLILTSATILFIGLTAFGQDGGKCAKKCGNKSNQTQCSKEQTCNGVYSLNAFTPEKKCMDEKAIAKNSVNNKTDKKPIRTNDASLISYNKKK